MKNLTALLALLMLLLIGCNDTEAKPNVNGNVGQNSIIDHEIDYSSSVHQVDSFNNELSYLSIYPIKKSRMPYIKQITGAICLLFAWFLIESYKD